MLENLQEAVELYYGKIELQNADVKKIFGVKSDSKVASLKKKVQQEMQKRGVPAWTPHGINTYIAFEVWGIDVADLEKRLKKLNKIRGVKENEA
ncbi:MAG: hypothetical protein IJV67_02460 [Clostridia bacterium]|nr:hypothetical protein [Clostridia bacterium]